MARNGNKSELIRKYFDSNPSSSVKDCIRDLAEGGVEVSYALVFGVRNRMKFSSRMGDVTNVADDEMPEPREVSLDEMKMVRDFVEKSNLDSDLAIRILKEFSSLVRGLGTIDRFDRVLENFSTCSKVFESSDEVVPGVVVSEPVSEPVSVESDNSYMDVNDEEDD